MSKYIKPGILFQPLNLSANITQSCSNHATHAENQCAVQIPGEENGVTIFTETAGCMFTNPGLFDQICYHVPVADGNVFLS